MFLIKLLSLVGKLLILGLFQNSISATNVALHKDVHVNVPSLDHPATNLVDGKLSTFWQSTEVKDNSWIELRLKGSLQKYYFGDKLHINFGKHGRPQRLAFLKSEDDGKTFEPFLYVVSKKKDCLKTFNVKYSDDRTPANGEGVICTTYKTGTKTKKHGLVTIDIRRSNIHTRPSPAALTWMKLNGIRLEFYEHWHHYTVREIELSAFCDCNGQGDGNNCPYNDKYGDNVCTCQAGACGTNCEKCCPAYNQYPWKHGNLGPFFPDKETSCQLCNCHNKTDVCEYNSTIAETRSSLDMNGNYLGGGVCVGCKNNTAGINCEKCKKFYYRPDTKSPWDIDACYECDCAGDDKLCSESTGQCVCPPNTTGRTCNKCKPRLWGWDSSEGCKPCMCNEVGSVNQKCDPVTGQCKCKPGVGGRDCSECLSGYKLFSESGCQPCLCEEAGSLTDECDAQNGQCACKSNVIGLLCSQCKEGTFHLSKENDEGCLNCFCMGISTKCSSTNMYRNVINETVHDWTLVKENKNKILDSKNVVLNGQIHLEANITGRDQVVWVSPPAGISFVATYGGNISFTLYYGHSMDPISSAKNKAVLKGGKGISIEQTFEKFEPGVDKKIDISLIESNWRHSDSEAKVTREDIIFILAEVDAMTITASFYSGKSKNTYVTRFGKFMMSSVSESPTDYGIAAEVEQCEPVQGYKGLSLEKCAEGYHRDNVTSHPYLGVCVPDNE